MNDYDWNQIKKTEEKTVKKYFLFKKFLKIATKTQYLEQNTRSIRNFIWGFQNARKKPKY